MSIRSVTCVAPVNIAVIKYWGKSDEKLIIPLNDSLSGTLHTDQMCAKTTVAFSPNFTSDRIWLNGLEEDITNPRLAACLSLMKSVASKHTPFPPTALDHPIHICSENNFPTAAGLASSAAGYACLVYSLAQLYQIPPSIDITSITRQGSGSACRSIYGGFVEWVTGSGEKADGSDSIANQIVPASHWPEMRIIILVVSDSRKKISSTSGMQRSCETSELLKHRVAQCVPDRMKNITKAIKSRDFETFAQITMQDSNQFHAVALDTYPPCVYMNDVSHAISSSIHLINKLAGRTLAAYTFDAGPNACLYLLENDLSAVLSGIAYMFPSDKPNSEYYRGLEMPSEDNGPLLQELKRTTEPYHEMNALRYIIHTKLGDGPKLLQDPDQSLLNADGLPKNCKK